MAKSEQEINEYRKKWRIENAAKMREYRKKWRNENVEKIQEIRENRNFDSGERMDSNFGRDESRRIGGGLCARDRWKENRVAKADATRI